MDQSGQFEFPSNSHILITTSSHIFAWSSTGICTVFRSKGNGIIAATEAQDESGLLAVADKHAVVVHDTKRGQEKSWGLQADGDEVRHLAYTTDAKSLFLSTTLTADIQRYSTERSRLLCPSRAHASPPVALAVSVDGRLMVSASDGPPVVYLKDLQHDTFPLLVEPRASKATVCVTAFHPERPNIFLLAFRDGTVAAYDATRVIRADGRFGGDQGDVNNAEISRIRTLHRPAPVGSKMFAITGVAFLRGFKTRAVTTGSDGRCRIVDFGEGGVILRTWHVKAPVTAVSALSLKRKSESRNQNAGSTASHVIGGPTSTDNLIAVGRADGEVHIYSSVGLLLSQCNPGEHGGKVLSVEWVKGPSPRPLEDLGAPAVTKVSPGLSVLPEEQQSQYNIGEGPRGQKDTTAKHRRETMFEHVGLPPELRKPELQTSKHEEIGPTRKLTIHPDELEAGTVRHLPNVEGSKLVPVGAGDYVDLFSSAKASTNNNLASAETRLASPPRSRAAITSQTFVKSPQPMPADQHDSVTRQRNLALFPSTSSASESNNTYRIQGIKYESSNPARARNSKQRRLSLPKAGVSGRSWKYDGFPTQSTHWDNKAGVLPSSQRSNEKHAAQLPLGLSSKFAPSRKAEKAKTKNAVGNTRGRKSRAFRRSTDHIETHLGSEEARAAYEHVHKRRDWPEDSIQGDVWQTSNSDVAKDLPLSHKHDADARPPGRQTSRSKVNSKGTFSTVAVPPADPASASAQRLKIDGSTEEEMFTADTHVTFNGTFSPSSREVRKLFPRTSSLSPRQRHRQRRPHRSPKLEASPLREITINTTRDQLAKSPWERARASKAARRAIVHASMHMDSEQTSQYEDPVCTVDRKENRPHCGICGPTKARVQELEADIARLKGEVLTLRAAFRRLGVPLPKIRGQR